MEQTFFNGVNNLICEISNLENELQGVGVPSTDNEKQGHCLQVLTDLRDRMRDTITLFNSFPEYIPFGD